MEQFDLNNLPELPKHLYRHLRPTIAATIRYGLNSRVLERADLIDDPPSGYTVFQFGEDEYYEFEEPTHVGELPEVIEKKLDGYRIYAPFVVETTEATLVGPSGIAFANGQIILESARGSYFRLVDASVKSLLSGQVPWNTSLQSPSKRYDRPVFSLVGPWATEYYHWFTDYLVRIFALEKYRDRTGREPAILIPEDASKWMLDSLSLTGFDQDRVIIWDGTRAEFSRLITGSVRFHTPEQAKGYIHSPQALSKLGDRIRNNVNIEHGEKRRLYVSRADATKRRVQNEDELMSILKEYEFERIVPGEYSFEEQVRRFADSEIILGPHGGGLTNLIFAEDTTLVELFGSYQNACYFGLASGIGHNYVSVMCQPQGSDMKVDVDEIVPILDDLTSG